MALLMVRPGNVPPTPYKWSQHASSSYVELDESQPKELLPPFQPSAGRSTMSYESLPTLSTAARQFRSASTTNLQPRMVDIRNVRPSTAAPRRMTENTFRPSTGIPTIQEGPYNSSDFPRPRTARQRAFSKADSTFASIKEKVHSGWRTQPRQPVPRPWEDEKPVQNIFTPCMNPIHLESDQEPVRLMLQRRPLTANGWTKRDFKLYSTAAVKEVSPSPSENTPKVAASKRISVSVHGLGQKVKNRMSSFSWKKEQRTQEVETVAEEQPRRSIALPREYTSRASGELLRNPSENGRMTPTLVPRGRELSRKGSLTASGRRVLRAELDEETLRQDSEPLIAPAHPNVVVDNGFGQAVVRQRPSTATADYFSRAASRTGSGYHSRAMSSHSLAGDDEQNLDEADTRVLPSLMLTRIQTAIQEADESGAFKEEIISARFDSAYGSSTNLDDFLDAAGRPHKNATAAAGSAAITAANSSIGPSPSQPSTPTNNGRSSRPRVRKAASQSAADISATTAASHSASAARSRSRPLMPKRSSVFSFSRPQSGTSTPAVKRDYHIADVANVAGKSIQRSSMMMLSGLVI